MIVICFLTRIKKGRGLGAISWHCRQMLQRMRAEFPTCWSPEIPFLRVRPNESTTFGFQSDRHGRERLKEWENSCRVVACRDWIFGFLESPPRCKFIPFRLKNRALANFPPLDLRDPNRLNDPRSSTTLSRPPSSSPPRRCLAPSARRGAFKSTA